MKRFHVHTHVADLPASIAFYSKLFAAEPTRIERDYAKWMLDDPRINFAISTRGGKPGVDHLGIQTDNEEELRELQGRARDADLAMLDEGQTTCCYARSDKYWLVDPQGVAWEHFQTLGDIPVFSQPESQPSAERASACCANQGTAEAKAETLPSTAGGCGCASKADAAPAAKAKAACC